MSLHAPPAIVNPMVQLCRDLAAYSDARRGYNAQRGGGNAQPLTASQRRANYDKQREFSTSRRETPRQARQVGRMDWRAHVRAERARGESNV